MPDDECLMKSEIRMPKSALPLDENLEAGDARFVIGRLPLEKQLVAGDVVDALQNAPRANPHRRHPGDKPAQRRRCRDPFLRSHAVSSFCATRETASAFCA